MVGHADILHHLVELISLHDRQRILLRLDSAALEGVVDLIGGRRDRLRPERRESVEDHLPRRNADLHTGEIVRLRDRAVDGRHLPHAVVEAGNGKKIHALGRHLLADIAAERPIDRLVRLRRRLEGEWYLLGLRHRHDRADDAAHESEELDFAGEEFLQRLGIAARNLVVFGVHGRLDAAVGLGANRIPHGDEILVQRAAGRLIVILHELMVGGARRLHDDSRSGCGGARDDEATRKLGCHQGASGALGPTSADP